MVLLQMDGSLGRPVTSALSVSCHPQHSSCPKAASEASCVLSLAAPDDDLPRPPLSMTLVVDLGSHSSEFIQSAIEAAVNLVDWMGPNDRAGIVAFSSQARLIYLHHHSSSYDIRNLGCWWSGSEMCSTAHHHYQSANRCCRIPAAEQVSCTQIMLVNDDDAPGSHSSAMCVSVLGSAGMFNPPPPAEGPSHSYCNYAGCELHCLVACQSALPCLGYQPLLFGCGFQ